MGLLSYIIKRPREAWRSFYAAYTGTEKLEDRAALEEVRLRTLRIAIAFYKKEFGEIPGQLTDLCFDKNGTPWKTPFIRWEGKGTFVDSFGYPYRYSPEGEPFKLVSPGLETAKQCLGQS